MPSFEYGCSLGARVKVKRTSDSQLQGESQSSSDSRKVNLRGCRLKTLILIFPTHYGYIKTLTTATEVADFLKMGSHPVSQTWEPRPGPPGTITRGTSKTYTINFIIGGGGYKKLSDTPKP